MGVKFLRVSAELFVQFLKEPTPPGITTEGLPSDMRIVNATWEDPGVIRLTVTSETFPMTMDIQNLEPIFHQASAKRRSRPKQRANRSPRRIAANAKPQNA